MNIATQVPNKTKMYKIFALSTAMLFINACSESNSDSEQTSLESNTLSGNVIDASKVTLVQKSGPNSSGSQNKATDTTGSFNYPTTLSEFSGNISVAFDVANPQGLKQVFIGFEGSDLTLPICQQDCGTEYSAFVNGINPTLFGLSGREQNITLWVEDNDNDTYQVTSLGLTWRELAISGVTVTLDESSEELSVSWNALTGMLRYNVYISNDESLTGQNYVDLDGGEAKLALTSTSTVFTEKPVNDIYYILVSGIDGSGESAFSDKVMLGDDDTTTIVTENSAPRFADQDGHIVTVDENSPEGTPVYTPSVTDPDEDAELTYSLSNGHGVFQMHSKTGVVYVNNQGLLDYETQPHSYELNMTVTDETSLSDSLTIIVQVNDVTESSKFALDTSFSNNGISDFNTYADTANNDYPVDAVLDDENNRYLLSYSDKPIDEADYVFTVSKIKQDGTFDLAFGKNGRKHLEFDNLNDSNVDEFDDGASIDTFTPTKLKIDNLNHKIYVLGYQGYTAADLEPFLLRLNHNGTIDNTFSQDGKYEYLGSGDSSEAVDLVIHSNGSLYLAISSKYNPLSQTNPAANFKLAKLSTSGSQSEAYNYELISPNSNVYVVGLVENTAGNLIALGYADNDGDGNVDGMTLEMLIDNLSTEANNTKARSKFDLGSTSDTVATYKQIDGDTVLLGGSTGTDSVIIKLKISELNSIPILDTDFNGSGYQTIDTQSVEESVVSLDFNSAGDITYISKVVLDSGLYELIPGQLDSVGLPTEVNTSLQTKELTNTSGSGIADENIHAVVLFDNSDTTNTINIFSSLEKENDNGLSPSEGINTELEIYYETLANNTSLEVLTSRTDYEFQIADSLAVDSKLLHSSGKIITVTPRYNDSGTGDNSDAEGHTITRHDFVTGLINQEQNSLLQRNGYSDNYIKRHSTQLIELAETDDNGDNYLLSAEIIEDVSTSTLRVTKFTIDGEIYSGFPVEKILPDYAYFENNAYNSTADRVALLGGYSDGQTENTENNSLLVTIELNCSSCPAFDVQEFSNTPGLVSSYNRLTSGVIQDDGSVIALGFGAVDDSLKEDVFLLKMNFDQSFIGIIDPDFDNSPNDGSDKDDGDDVLKISTGNSNNVHSGKLVQLSDSSLVYIATQTESDAQSYLVRLIDTDASSTQKYAIDVNFDDISAGDSGVDGIILLDMDSLSANPLNIEVKDLAVNSNDEIILVGNVSTTEIDAGFIAKFNGLNGEADSLVGKNSLSGYSIPNGDAGCNYLNTGQNEGDLCDILGYDRVSIASDGSLIIHALLPDSSGSSNNSAIMKFTEQHNDNASSYTISNG
ncbi:hypothetical protein GCM10008107_23960 [Psychrosphaera saromensis]|uniref:Cadherin domain-containing protein n=1 Tax=Psychrosphaera saromensis TaxID=716813 RepID=A0A2S7URQ6_9GAMM|nr:cadherin repeat domain-containing protein [Psychrosphaera saromensis]PQJ52428.1 hypothetical protein BTO11_01345 [Psychrosphaera saromensis]GHB73678.1 hypothetical protein GCM10008107_23960 [Psychrosphaera saromensis]GLQ13401.1 hypothetical protein GCM10007917_08560 [Psychrosphaera saromensis]